MKNQLLTTILMVFIFFTGYAQDIAITDTIEYARSKAYQKDFAEADRLLSSYSKSNTDINALRLHAQVLYWMKEFDRSAMIYENALKAFPDVTVVKLDYGRMLWELNKLPKATLLLNDYLATDKQNAEANILLAYINYWKGDIKTAKDKLATVLLYYPHNETALAIWKEINEATAPFLKVGGNYASDDQPLKKAGFSAEAGWYKSWWFSPDVRFDSYQFNAEGSTYNSFWVQAGNKLFFGHSGLTLNFKGGLFSHATGQNALFTGAGAVTLKLSKAISLSAGIERLPYQYTITSIKIPVMEQLSSIAINLNKNNKWLGKAAFELQGFDDLNKIQTAYLWLLIPVIDKNNFKLKTGYAFNYSNADKNTFTASQPLSTLIATTTVGSAVAGYYNPYFTPSKQTVHSLLAAAEIQFSKNVKFTSRASVGVVAHAYNPELILNKNPGNIFSINKTSINQSYTPIDFNNELNIKLSKRISSAVQYGYSRLLFYTINQGSIHLKYAFINDNKK